MRIRKLHQRATGPLAPATPKRHRRVALLGAGTLVVALATTGIVAALSGRSAPATQHSSSTLVSPATTAAAHPSRSGRAVPKPAGAPTSPSTTPPAAPMVLADGTYPTYIRGVDIDGATITIDVIQLFRDKAARTAAIEDGKSPSEARYLYVYIRNQNPLLRTFPVAPDVHIEFVGTCEEPPTREKALTELAKKTTPFTTAYYYDVTVRDGAINAITQRLAIPAC